MRFFRCVRPGAVGSRCRVLTSFPSAGADERVLHQTLIEALSPWRWRVQRAVSMVLCGLETYLCPHTVLFKGVAERVPFAS